MPVTLYDKLWNEHLVQTDDTDESLIYIDRHYLHEVTSPQAFEGLRHKQLKPWRLDANVATPDHNVPTDRGNSFNAASIQDEVAKIQVVELDKNCNNFGIHQFDITSNKQGIVHVMGPELGYTLPGMTIVCGDSHTSTHGAFGCLAMGIGTSEVEHVLATQCLKITKLKNMRINFNGHPQRGVTSKDIVLNLIKLIGTAGGTGHAIEFSGSYISSASMESRMTICNMAIEAGAKVGLAGVDETTLDYVKKHSNLSDSIFGKASEYWQTLKSDPDLLVGDLVNKERYVMLPAEPGEGDPVLGKFRTVSDANRFASRSDITEFSLWTRLKVVGGGSLKEDFKDSDDEEEIDDDLGDLLDDDSDLPDLEEDADLDELL
jgi:3-isopropylmalate/(R)-2-methylmalate dehydratase large subunit